MDIRTDENGYLRDPSDWNTAVAEELARREGLVLSEEHWAVLHFMRAHLERNHVAPDARHVIRYLKETYGSDRNHLFRLFVPRHLVLYLAGNRDIPGK